MYSSCRQDIKSSNQDGKESFLNKNVKSLYVTESSRQSNLKHRMISFLTRQATKDFQQKLIYKNLATKNKYVKQFIDKLLARKFFQIHFKEYHYRILNEKYSAILLRVDENNKLLKNHLINYCHPFYSWIAKKINKIPLIYPQSIYKTIWDVLATIARLYFLYMIPVDICWTQEQLLFDNYFISTLIMISILLVDIFISLNTVFYEAGQIVTKRIQIIKNVLWQSFGLEWISTFIVFILFLYSLATDTKVDINQNPYYIILLLFLSHYKNVQNKGKQYEMALNFTRQASSILQLFKFTLLIFYVIHIFGCLWFWGGQFSELYRESSWIDDRNLLDKSWNIQYLSSFYYACVTMFTVGYGDITPKSDEERIIAILLIMVSSVQLPYSINTVGNVISEITSQSELQKKNIRIINTYLHKKRIPYAFQEQIREYLKQYWIQQQEEETMEEKTIINQLSEKLQEQLMWQVNTQVIREMPFFSQFSRPFQKALSKRISVVDLLPENEFRKELDQFVCYVEKGEISVCAEGQNKIKIRQVMVGETFGLKGFVLGIPTNEIYKSVGFSKLLMICRYDFIQLLKEFPRDFELYCKTRDGIQFSDIVWDEQCLSCQSPSHSIINCPMLHYIPSRDLIIKRYQFDHKQMRMKFKRKHRICNNTLDLEILKKIQNEYYKKYHFDFQEKPPSENKSQIQIPKIIIQHSSPPAPSRKNSQLNFNDPFNFNQVQGLKHSISIIGRPQNPIDYVRQNNQQIINYDPEQDNIINDAIEDQLKQRFYQLKNYKNLPPKDKEAISFLIMKYKNFKKFEKKQLKNFEQKKSYTDYYPEHNGEKMIHLANLRNRDDIISKLMPYLLFPNVYFQRFQKKLY
ncbi:unnamed protein product [Paramecium primaurelia]|uniref:Cyclic nucleotide-binding domain-containing protein n=1 Tax=Paramecium primaurelia TaxID=5886 RepID=A0A8S1KJZ5_PARPR|nr:unnamed protein product [Paramecium primaurelia]